MDDVTCYLLDMDGVLVREDEPIPGAPEFVRRLQREGLTHLLLTNNPIHTPRTLASRLQAIDIPIGADRIWTSALATAWFLSTQRPHGSAYVVGEAGLTTALHEVGYTLVDRDPDYVVVGETRTYSFEAITRAIRLVDQGARFVTTNPDPVAPSPNGLVPATGSVAAMVTAATGVQPYPIGKPNPLMVRSALRFVGAHSDEAVMVGDNMETDIIGGVESGLRSVLVLSGITDRDQVQRHPFQPTRVVESVAELV